MLLDIIEVKASLTLYSTKDGGRNTGIKSGYRPNHVFEYEDNSNQYKTTYIGQIEFDKSLVLPSETHCVKVIFLKHRNIKDFIEVGRVWWIHEGDVKVGEAIITEIVI